MHDLPEGVSSLDWKVGEKIVIASTDFDGDHAEERTITGVSNNGLTLELDSKLEYKHYAGEPTYGEESISMRAEVGLLSRNIKFRGEAESTQANDYGAHIMLAGQGVKGRFSNI